MWANVVAEGATKRGIETIYRNNVEASEFLLKKKIRIGTSVERLSVKADFETNSSMQSMIFTDQFD